MKSENNTKTSSTLPHGWEEFYDNNAKCKYYHNDSLDLTQWEPPTIVSVDLSLDNNFKGQESKSEQANENKKISLPLPRETAYSDMDEKSLHNIANDIDDFADDSSTIYMPQNDTIDEKKSDDIPTTNTSSPGGSEIANNLTKKTSKKNLSKQESKKLNKQNGLMPSNGYIGGTTINYLGEAKQFREQRRFYRSKEQIICVICKKLDADHVFFPCEHRSVCSACIERENFCADSQMDKSRDGYCMCPICANPIKLILPFENGVETEKYWEWVSEIRPYLSSAFKRDFRHSAAVIQKVYIDDNLPQKENCSIACTIS
mmetsp:Transcript_3992/g.4076  ORF Transcript_3992/g.4076 Transcript_3992/m.4076 type:complete len:316 (-) Transcript_3992:226-1173(-)